MMRILVATDAWHPQVNGVVRTLTMMADAAKTFGVEVSFLTPASFRTFAMPSYPDLRLALPYQAKIARLIAEARPDSIHIATEGPIGLLVRRYCRKHGLPFTTSFHTRFPEYISARLPVRESWIWAALRRFHGASQAVMAATPALANELRARGFRNVVLWPRGVDTSQFHPRAADLGLPRPVFLCVGRVAVEKNLEAFLDLDLPGTKVIVGDGPARAALERKYPQAVFLGARQGEALAQAYAAADVFVFPSKTDTFGLVLLEALASGVPVAAFPVTGPRDVIGSAPVGALNDDLRAACLAALRISPQACLEFAAEHTWEASARAFVENITGVRHAGAQTSCKTSSRKAMPCTLPQSSRASSREILVLTRFLPQIGLRNLRKLDCYANRYPPASSRAGFRLKALSHLARLSGDAIQVWHVGIISTAAGQSGGYRRRRARAGAVRRANAAVVVAGSQRARRHPGFPEAGDAAADRIVQVPRRLQQAVVDPAKRAQRRRGRVLVRQPCPGRGGGGEDPEHAGDHRDAVRRAAVQARAHQVLRRRSRAVRSRPRGP